MRSLLRLLYEENSVWVFVLLTVVLGGGASALTGRAIAATWRPWWHVIPFTLLLGAAVRFLHFALFGDTLLSPAYYVADTAVCLLCGLIGFRLMRVRRWSAATAGSTSARVSILWRRKAVSGRAGSSESG